MMQSVALTDSVQHDDDFVVVEAPIGSDDTTSYDDEASYDYCDDVFSIASIAQSFSVSSHALQALQEDFFDYPHPNFLNKTGEEGLPADLQELRISSVEAAADDDDDTKPAASELNATVSYNFEISPEETSIHAKEIPDAATNESTGDGQESSPSEDSASAESGSEKESSDTTNEGRTYSHSSGGESRSSRTLSSSFDGEKEDSGGSTDEDKVEAVASAVETALGKKSSRLSGKKRRKQLKLAKKAAAAAAAAAALGQMTMPVQTSARGKKSRQTTTRSSGKKVANIAVSCVTHAVTAYREELRLKKQIR